MKTSLIGLLVILSVVLAIPSIAAAQKSAGGVVGVERTRPGTWETTRSGRDYFSNNYRSYDTTRSNNAVVIVRSEPAPQVVEQAPSSAQAPAVAQAPSTERRFSYEPSQPAGESSVSGTTTYTPYTPAPRMRSRTTQRDRYKLPAGVPEKYRVN